MATERNCSVPYFDTCRQLDIGKISVFSITVNSELELM